MDTKESTVLEDTPAPVSKKQEASNITPVSRPLFLFEQVTVLLSGLIALSLLSLTGYTLLDYWLGDSSAASFFNSYLYSYYLYLLCGLLFFTALHFWAHWRSERTVASAPEATARTANAFLAVFLAILTITVVSSIVAVAYIAVNAALGTADYSAKGLWNALLGPLQAGVWAGLLCWYFKGANKGRSTTIYMAVAGVISLVAMGLLLAFPLLAKRDAVIDSRTSNDLSSLSFAVNEFATNSNKLPENLSEVELDDKVKSRLSNYEYQKVANATTTKSLIEEDDADSFTDLLRSSNTQLSYKLCATFKTNTSSGEDKSPIPFLGASSDFSAHPAGKHCFDKTTYGKGADGSSNSGSSSSDVLESY